MFTHVYLHTHSHVHFYKNRIFLDAFLVTCLFISILGESFHFITYISISYYELTLLDFLVWPCGYLVPIVISLHFYIYLFVRIQSKSTYSSRLEVCRLLIYRHKNNYSLSKNQFLVSIYYVLGSPRYIKYLSWVLLSGTQFKER